MSPAGIDKRQYLNPEKNEKAKINKCAVRYLYKLRYIRRVVTVHKKV